MLLLLSRNVVSLICLLRFPHDCRKYLPPLRLHYSFHDLFHPPSWNVIFRWHDIQPAQVTCTTTVSPTVIAGFVSIYFTEILPGFQIVVAGFHCTSRLSKSLKGSRPVSFAAAREITQHAYVIVRYITCLHISSRHQFTLVLISVFSWLMWVWKVLHRDFAVENAELPYFLPSISTPTQVLTKMVQPWYWMMIKVWTMMKWIYPALKSVLPGFWEMKVNSPGSLKT